MNSSATGLQPVSARPGEFSGCRPLTFFLETPRADGSNRAIQRLNGPVERWGLSSF